MFLLIFFGVLLTGCSLQDQTGNHQSKETIASTVEKITCDAQNDTEKMQRIYYFVRDEIKFGWVYPQEIPAEEVLKNRKGVCMQKANLLVAMAREAGIKARFHFMYVHKTALEDFLPQFAYNRWVDPFPHTFPEVWLNGRWISMEATFDKELHEICLRNKLNFGKYEEIAENVSIDFSQDGVKGHQQFFHADEKNSFYGDDLSLFKAYINDAVPWWKKIMQPFIFSKAQRIMEKLRHNHRNQT